MTAEIIQFKPRHESAKAKAARLVRMWRESGGSDEELLTHVRRIEHECHERKGREDYYKAIGHRLREARTAGGLSEQEAARVAGVTVRTWRKYEAGLYQRTGRITLFALNTGTPIEWLVLGEYGAAGGFLLRGNATPVTYHDHHRS
jgi:DNA-binding XRE family transcriptional regulator